MQRILKIIFSILIGILFFSCSDNRSKTWTGHPYIHHIKNATSTPNKGDIIEYHIRQRNANGLGHSSYEDGKPKLFRIPEVDIQDDKMNRISPITEALMLMSVGDSLTLEILMDSLPEMLANKKEGESMFFDLKMISIKSKNDIEKEKQNTIEQGNKLSSQLKKNITAYKKGELKKLQKSKSGFDFISHEEGNGRQIKNGDIVLVHYIGQLQENGKQFYNTYTNTHPYQIKVGAGRVIEAWDKMLPELHIGDEITLFVPYDQAYGAAGSKGLGIPEKSDLAFYMNVVQVK